MGSNNIERTSQFNQDTGDSEYTYCCLDSEYTYCCSGKECPADYIESPIANKYIGYDLIHHDLESARAWITLAYKVIDTNVNHRPKEKTNSDVFLPHLEGDENEILQALFISSVTYYGKCFTSAEGRRIKLEESNLPTEFLSTHKNIMKFRNTIAAHSGEGPWDTARLALIAHPDGKPESTVVWSELKLLQFFDNREEEINYKKLVESLKEMIHKKLHELREVILLNRI